MNNQCSKLSFVQNCHDLKSASITSKFLMKQYSYLNLPTVQKWEFEKVKTWVYYNWPLIFLLNNNWLPSGCFAITINLIMIGFWWNEIFLLFFFNFISHYLKTFFTVVSFPWKWLCVRLFCGFYNKLSKCQWVCLLNFLVK